MKITINANDAGEFFAGYIGLRDGTIEYHAKNTIEVIDNAVLFDYDESGKLFGIEILAKFELIKLLELLEDEAVRHFISWAIPNQLFL